MGSGLLVTGTIMQTQLCKNRFEIFQAKAPDCRWKSGPHGKVFRRATRGFRCRAIKGNETGLVVLVDLVVFCFQI